MRDFFSYYNGQLIKGESSPSRMKLYNQTNCTTVVADGGVRITRTANISSTLNFGGIAIYPWDTTDCIPVKGNTYVIAYDVEGYSDQATTKLSPTVVFGSGENNSKTGLDYSISSLEEVKPEAGFNGKKSCYTKFTLAAEPYQTCTTTYNSYCTAGTVYNVYNCLNFFNYTYGSSGSNGTDMLVTNIRFYDITDLASVTFTKAGNFDIGGLIEYGYDEDVSSFKKYSEYRINELIEY